MELWATKTVTLFLILASTLLFGLAPIFLVQRVRSLQHRSRAVGRSKLQFGLSLINCLAGGVFLGTTLLHMIPEVREDFDALLEDFGVKTDFAVAEFVVTGGFFVIMIIENVVMVVQHHHVRKRSLLMDQERVPILGGEEEGEGEGPTARGTPVKTYGTAQTRTRARRSGADQHPSSKDGLLLDLSNSTEHTQTEAHAGSSAGDAKSGNGGSSGGGHGSREEGIGGEKQTQQCQAHVDYLLSAEDAGVVAGLSEKEHDHQHTDARPHPHLAFSQRVRVDGVAMGGSPLSDSGRSCRHLPVVVERGECVHVIQPTHHQHHHDEAHRLGGIRSFLLLLALSLHTVFEGVAIGLQPTNSAVFNLFIAIVVHKSVIAFSMGLQFAENLRTYRKAALFIALFSLMSPLGVLTGTLLFESEGGAQSGAVTVVSAVLQAVAAGTFLYVTFFEVLHKEVGQDHSLLKVLFILLGFGAMVLLFLFNGEPHDPQSN